MIEELSVPLRDVVNYEEQVNDDSDMYEKLLWAERQINSSLEEIQDMVHNLMLYYTIASYTLYCHMLQLTSMSSLICCMLLVAK